MAHLCKCFCSRCVLLDIGKNGKPICTKFNLTSIDDRKDQCGGKYKQRAKKRHFLSEPSGDKASGSRTTLTMTREELYEYFESRKKIKAPLW